ncbi:MAG TPA: arylsulfatase [Acidimicrobiia bacterium]|nr:arylsulfatase [Acidimicrobiia bacterium]
MARPYRGKIALDIRDSVPDWEPFLAPRAPAGAPNVLFIVWDDLGYSTMDFMGGPVEAPTMRRIAERGVVYSNFHTTALCSPTRASLLTGRNATSNGMATIAEFSAGFPGISCRVPFENGFVSEVLAERGYNTYCIGKWHLTPGEECNLAAFKGRWPLGRGFERFYGWLGGETNSWYPDLVHDNHQIDPPGRPEDGYHLADDLSDRAIEFVRDAKVIDPDKPFFLYFAPQAGHAPHLVAQEWADRYRGKFDMGYEAIRAGILERQQRLGLLPAQTELSPINPHGEPARTGPDGQPWPLLDTVRPWDSLSADEQRLFARMAEVFAGYISYYDDQLGRIVDYLEESGQLDNTIVVAISDNGASGEGGPNGSFNEWRFFNGIPDTTETTLPHIDELGSPSSYNHYNTGWAWALDTPFPYWKRWAGYEGGVADMCVVSWPAKIPASKEIRHQYVHAVDIVPTVYELLGVEPPETLKGYAQSPIEGESFAATLTDPNAPGKSTQFYAMLGQRAIYHDGWLACSAHPPLSGWGKFEHDEWELYHLDEDRAQCHNIAAHEPDRLATLQSLWFYHAGINNGLPLDDRTALEQVLAERPRPAPDRDRHVFYPHCADVPEDAGATINGRSFTIAAGVDITAPDAKGVIFAQGGVCGGQSLYVKDRKLRYTFNWVGTHLQDVVADAEITPGTHVVTADFALKGPSTDASMPGFTGTLTLYIDDQKVGQGEIVTQPGYFNIVGDGICVGRDSASPVSPEYASDGTFPFTGGTIDKVVVDVSGTPFVDHERQVMAWFAKD